MGVVILLGVIGLIATTAISNTMKENSEKLYNTQIDNIINGAKLWANSHPFELPEKEGESLTLTLGQIQNEGFAKDVRNPKTNQLFDQNMEIKVTKQNNSYIYEIVE